MRDGEFIFKTCLSKFLVIRVRLLLRDNNRHRASGKIRVYRSPDCLSADLSVFLSGKGLPREKEIIFRLAPLPGRPSLDPHSGSGAMNEKKETQSIAPGRRNSRCVIDRNGIIVRFLRRQQCPTPIAQKGARKTLR